MKSVVIISPLLDELSRIRDLWIKKEGGEKISFVGADRLTIGVDKKYVIIDYLENGKQLYDAFELNELILNTFYFYNIIYSDKETLVEFVFSSSFSKECFIDNDHGCIVPLNKLSRKRLLSIIE